MPQFVSVNSFNWPHCNEMLDGATGFFERDKPVHDQFTICVFCAKLCVYVIQDGKVSLRDLNDEDYKHIENNPAFKKEIDEMIEFVKSKPK